MRHTGQHGAHVRDLTEFPARFAVRPVSYAIARVLVPRWYTPVNFSRRPSDQRRRQDLHGRASERFVSFPSWDTELSVS